MKKIKVLTIAVVILSIVLGSIIDINKEYKQVQNSYKEISQDVKDLLDNTLIVIKVLEGNNTLTENKAATYRKLFEFKDSFKTDYRSALEAIEFCEKYKLDATDAERYLAEVQESSNIIKHSSFAQTAENYNKETGTFIGSFLRTIIGKSKIEINY